MSLVWSAGRAGFFSSPAEMAAETGCVADAISLARRLRTVMSGCRLDFHFISSAGGLFEGQRTVHARSRPRPVRPYGQAKLAQEELLRRSFERGQLQIYRPSSVYGPLHRKPRQGLINTLVDDARGGRVTVLDANVMSLRDYVFAGDIGAFVARAVAAWRHDPQAPDVRFLVSARCTSIQEAMQKVQRTLSLRVNYRLDRDFGNSRHITFHPDVLPPGWRPSTLDVGIRQFLVSR